MATAVMSLDSITVPDRPAPPRIVIHGVHGVGKTTFACQAPNPIVIRTEDGLGVNRVPTFPLCKSYGDVISAMRALMGKHTYRTLIVDSLDWLEPLIWEATAREKGKEHLEEFGYGKGYLYADERWAEFLNALNILRDRQGMTIVLIAHTDVKRFDAPDTEPYDRYVLKLHRRAAALIDEWADIVGFARWEVVVQKTDVGFDKEVRRGIGTGQRRLALEERPGFDAKNRYGLPEEIPLHWGAFREALRVAFTGEAAVAAPAPADTTNTSDAETSQEEPQHA